MNKSRIAFDKINKLVDDLKSLQPMSIDAQRKLEKKFRLEFNYNSNHIEGNTLTYGETELLLIFDDTKGNHTLREYEEMKSHDVAYQLIRDWAKSYEQPLNERDIKELNKILLVRPFWKDAVTPDGQQTRREIKVGEYKTQPNSVRLQNGEMFHYASPLETPIKMGELIDWFRAENDAKELHPVALAALLHYKFVCIHPFDDGNGRVSRLLMNYVLFSYNLPPVIIKSANKRAYLSALNSADTGDIDSFIEYIAQQVEWSLDVSIKAAKGESIEEADDLDKEIAVWKKQAVTKTVDGINVSDAIIYEIYTKGVKDLFEQFIEKHKQFYELFTEANFVIYLNGKQFRDLNSLNDTIDSLNTKPIILSTIDSTPQIPKKNHISFDNFALQIKLIKYKFGEEIFNIEPLILIEFKPYRYEISALGRKRTKKYDEYIDADLRNAIVSESVKHVFSEIKSRAK
jgi:Fic family protein